MILLFTTNLPTLSTGSYAALLVALGSVLLAGLAATPASASPSTDEPLGHVLYGAGPERVIVLHNWTGSSATYRAWLPHLDIEQFTYAFADLRGYGASQDLGGPYTTGQAAADVFALADALGWDRFHLVGHSFSGKVVQRAALDDAQWPEADRRIRSVTAITPISAEGYPATEEDRQFFNAIPGNMEVTTNAFTALTGGRLSAQWAQTMAKRNLQTARPEAMQAYLEQIILGDDFSAEAAEADLPTPMLVVAGRHDLPGVSEAHLRDTFGARYPEAEVVTIESAGHYPMIETPAFLASLVQGFLLSSDVQGNGDAD